ncbi:hematopoietic cell signal transducer [Diceros bicornis minor]|uniref:hematopoietic cell signal transducer n=1 Tax=Diceros bicornis minor TaxID=77932 RepID=UPI0026F071FB|nr:hematopoietic cell signal transducer [Diceros bicornis minor]
MVPPGNILLLLLLPVAAAQMTPGSCSGCGPLSLPLLAGLVAADALVSLLIVAVVFVCARPRSRPTQGEEDGKVYINMPGRG